MIRPPRILLDAALLALLALLFATAAHFVHAPLPWNASWTRHAFVRASAEGFAPLDLEALRTRLDSPSPPTLLDARPPALYARAHIPSALSVPAGDVDAALAPLAPVLDPAAPVVVYCDGLDCADSLETARTLRALGFADIALFPGGFAAWTAADLPVEAAP